MSWYTLNVYLHVLAAMVWVGGMLFLSLVAVPATRGMDPALRAGVLRAVGRRFRVVGWTALIILIVTGLINADRFGYGLLALVRGEWLASRFGQMLTAKFTLVVIMVGLTLAHDLLSLRVSKPPSPAREGKRPPGWSAWFARLNLLVALAVVLLAVVMLRVSL